jgi:hypothetical protein
MRRNTAPLCSRETAPNTAAHGMASSPTSPRVVANITMQQRQLRCVCACAKLQDPQRKTVASPQLSRDRAQPVSMRFPAVGGYTFALLHCLACVASASTATGTVTAVYELLARVLPEGVPPQSFNLVLDPGVGPGDTFSISNSQPDDADVTFESNITVVGSTVPALTAGLGWYLKTISHRLDGTGRH